MMGEKRFAIDFDLEDLEKENMKLREKINELEMENKVLKKSLDMGVNIDSMECDDANNQMNELLKDLQQVSELDGYGACWCEHCDDEICATSQFWSYKPLAEKYNIDYGKYGMKENGEDYDVEETIVLWDNGSSLSYEIAQEIKRQIREV